MLQAKPNGNPESDGYLVVDSIGSVKFTVRREHGSTPNGNALDGKWVARDPNGIWIDFDKYRFDLFDRLGVIASQEIDI